jgi:mannose-1-phosphate guanylyltransferase
MEREERQWGLFEVLSVFEGKNDRNAKIKKLIIESGKNISYQKHEHRSEIWVILDGTGELVIDGTIYVVGHGDYVSIPVGTWHSIKAFDKLTIAEVQMGDKVSESDIIREWIEWEDIEKYVIGGSE